MPTITGAPPVTAAAHAQPVRRMIALVATLMTALTLLGAPPAVSQTDEAPPGAAVGAPAAGGFTLVKNLSPSVTCDGPYQGGIVNTYFQRGDCMRLDFTVTETAPTDPVRVDYYGPNDTEPFATDMASSSDAALSEFRTIMLTDNSWSPGRVRAEIFSNNTLAGAAEIVFNYLQARLSVGASEAGGYFAPGEDISVSGTIEEINEVGVNEQRTPVGASFRLRATDSDGTELGIFPPLSDPAFTASGNGTFDETIPGSATAGVTPDITTNFRRAIRIEVIEASYVDDATGPWYAKRAGATAATIGVLPDSLLLEANFTSSVGWVKPGESYPFRMIVRNLTGTEITNAAVTVAPIDGTTYTAVTPVAVEGGSAGTAAVNGDGSITWTLGNVPTGSFGGPSVRSIIVNATADTTDQDPQIVWKNLSSTGVLTHDGLATPVSQTAHGPKVIPPKSTYESARYGDRPFPVVPVAFADRPPSSISGDNVAAVINDPAEPGSTFNLFQEMSYGQLYPNGTVPSAGIGQADWDDYPYDFHTAQTPPPNTCSGAHFPEFAGTPFLPERILDGWYHLPGNTGYYGQDAGGSAISPVASSIDAGCGDTGKSVYDAAAIADPEINYSDFDTDKDGVVDFFMMIFVGVGGNGVSQTSAPPYDNIWPHSSTLESGFCDADTGLCGYISDDQLHDLEDRPLWFTDLGRTAMTTEDMGEELIVFTRVGPYNVNPESALDKASVISHEYAHSLGLPDYYSGAGVTGTTQFYGTWNLMASDYSQNIDVQGRQELGWVIPQVLDTNSSLTIEDMQEAKTNTHEITWQQPDGTPYTLTGPTVDNGEAYGVRLPAKILLDPALVENGGSPSHVWWSQSGNSFDCGPTAAHNLDIRIPELEDIAPGTDVTLEFANYWDIEWDFDYGFVLVTTDGGDTYTSLASENGYTTPATQNPNNNQCLARYGNGLTGTSGAYDNQGLGPDLDRAAGEQTPGDRFLPDSYDLTAFAGQDVTLRFSYSTDVGLARPGWFIDDLTVRAGDDVLYSSDFETSGQSQDTRVFNGACREDLKTGPTCTDGWSYISSEEGSPADHAYYFELRDRVGFDFDGRGEADRGSIGWQPGISLAFTDEALGYGNSSRSDRPNQHVIDAAPDPGNLSPNLDDAAFVPGGPRATFSDFGEGHVDNYTDPGREDNQLRFDFNCLELEVLSMTSGGAGADDLPSPLRADVQVTTGGGCGVWDYGYSAVEAVTPGSIPVTRVAGDDRIDTGIENSKKSFPDGDAGAVVLARSDNFADALAGTPLAAAKNAPLLLSRTASLDPRVRAEIDRVITPGDGVLSTGDTVYILGGTSAISQEVEDELSGAGYEVVRLEGPTRFETAVAIAGETNASPDTVFIARSHDFADGLVAGAAAAKQNGVVVLTRADTSNAVTDAYLATQPEAKQFAIGGGAARAYPDADGIVGDNRYATAVAAAKKFFSSPELLGIARGDDFPDALTGGANAALAGAPILLTPPTSLSVDTRGYLCEVRGSATEGRIYGGTAAVSGAVQADIQRRLNGEGC